MCRHLLFRYIAVNFCPKCKLYLIPIKLQKLVIPDMQPEFLGFLKYQSRNTYNNKAFCLQSSYFRVHLILQYFYWDLSYVALHCILHKSFKNLHNLLLQETEQSGIVEFCIKHNLYQTVDLFPSPNGKEKREKVRKKKKYFPSK